MKKLFLLLWFIGLGLQAQTFELSGIIKNNNGNPVNHAKITIDQNITTFSDSQGMFKQKLNSGKHYIEVHKKGFKIYKANVQLNQNLYLEIELLPEAIPLEEIVIYSVTATPDMPVTQTNIKKHEIEEKNLAEDIPYLLNLTPNTVATSDAGAGVGYTGIRIRGISPQQINVTLNGVPLNDPESHGVYWVDIPDFASSTESIQIQRGVGTSTFGTGAFGAAISLTTDKISKNPYTQIQSVYGSFNTQKISFKGSTGLLNKHFEFSGRISKIKSDGYIDRASSKMNSYFLSGTYKDKKNQLKTIIFGGAEKTYQAWYGVDKNTFDENPTFNYAGAIYDNNWNIIDFYDNEIDNYNQDHYQLHYQRKIGQNIKFNLTGHYTYGRGYYEQYKQNADFSDYGLTPLNINGITIDQTDLIRRKWLDNDFYGATASLAYQAPQMKIILGLAANEYDGRHFGRIIWARYASDSEIRHEYYRNTGIKKNIGGFAKSIYKISNQLKLYTDLQFRKINYKINGTIDYDYPFETIDNLFFINPKIGLFYDINPITQAYFSIAQTHREPNRDDYINQPTSLPKPETLNDVETGLKINKRRYKIEANLYGMFYKDQLVLTGEIDNVGNPIRKNVGKSYRVGLEMQAGYQINKKMDISGNIAYSQNKNIDYYEYENNQIVKYGDTDLPYSPSIIAGANINIKLSKAFKINLMSKYVGEQFMNNLNTPESKLDAYYIQNILMSYQISPQSYFKNVNFQLKVNNLFNKKYASNGYMWGNTAYYFPQAGTNFLASVIFKF